MVAAAIIGGAVVAGGAAYAGSSKAASAQESAANSAAGEQAREFNITQANAAPAIAAGQAATNRLNSIFSGSGPDYSSFYTSPNYAFTKQQGMQGIENSFSASGGAKSGNALKALDQYNSNLAAGQFGNYFNQQASIAGLGQTATGQVGTAGSAAGAQIGNSLIQGGDARASGIVGQYNAIGSTAGQAGQALGYYLQNRNYPTSTISGSFGSNPSGDAAAGDYAAWSDRRLKEDVEQVGKTNEGLPLYKYRLKGDPEARIGVMADEAKKKFPRAVKTDPSGYKKVNYMGIR